MLNLASMYMATHLNPPFQHSKERKETGWHATVKSLLLGPTNGYELVITRKCKVPPGKTSGFVGLIFFPPFRFSCLALCVRAPLASLPFRYGGGYAKAPLLHPTAQKFEMRTDRTASSRGGIEKQAAVGPPFDRGWFRLARVKVKAHAGSGGSGWYYTGVQLYQRWGPTWQRERLPPARE